MPTEQPQLKMVVLSVLEESGFEYDPNLNFDIDFPEAVYGQGKGCFFVVVDKGVVVGTAAVEDQENRVSRWRRLTLLPEYRGLGWGLQIQHFIIDYCREVGFVSARFDTLARFGMIEKYQQVGCYVIKEEVEGENLKVYMGYTF